MNAVAPAPDWRPINSAHAIQSVYGAIVFSQPVTTIIWKRIVESAQNIATKIGLSEKSDVQTFLVQFAPGVLPTPIDNDQMGVEFFKRSAQSPLSPPGFTDKLTLESTSIRLDCLSYTRWAGFEEKLRLSLDVLPLFTQAVAIRQIALEYVDVFIATRDGDVDSSLVIDEHSGCLARQAFHATSQWHSHVGWFEHLTDVSRVLVNVDLTVGDANTPEGVRRAITIRTHQALHFLTTEAGDFAAQALTKEDVLTTFDESHTALKERLSLVLTPLGRELISLGGN